MLFSFFSTPTLSSSRCTLSSCAFNRIMHVAAELRRKSTKLFRSPVCQCRRIYEPDLECYSISFSFFSILSSVRQLCGQLAHFLFSLGDRRPLTCSRGAEPGRWRRSAMENKSKVWEGSRRRSAAGVEVEKGSIGRVPEPCVSSDECRTCLGGSCGQLSASVSGGSLQCH